MCEMLMMKRTLFVLPLIIFYVINCTLGIVVEWGEECEFTEECGDHRLVCDNVTESNITKQLCICDRFHEWNGTKVGCVLKYSPLEILGTLKEKYNLAERIEYEANVVFLAQIVAGMIVLGVGLVCSLIVAAYCYRMWKQDTELDEIVEKLESQKENNKPSFSRRAR